MQDLPDISTPLHGPGVLKKQSDSSLALPDISTLPDIGTSANVTPKSKEPPGFFGSLANISKTIAHVAGFGAQKDVDATRDILYRNAFDQENATQTSKILADKLSNMFSAATFKSTGQSLLDTGKNLVSSTISDPMGTAKGAVGMITGLPLGMLNMVTNPVKTMTGLDITADDPAGFTAEQQADQIKETLGTAAGFIVGSGVSKAIDAAKLASAASDVGIGSGAAKEVLANTANGIESPAAFAGVKTPDLINGALKESHIGALGEKMLSHAAEGAAFGATQTAFTHSGREDTVAQMVLSAVSFAPLGAASALLGDVVRAKRGIDAPVSDGQKLKAAAYDVALTRQVSATVDKSLDEIVGNAGAVAQSNNILEAVIRGKIATNPKAISIFRNVDPDKLSNINPDGLTISKFARPDGNFDVIAFPNDNALFEGRQVPKVPNGGLIDRKRDSNGNLIAQVGDPVIKTTKKGDLVHGIITMRNGEMWVRPIEVEDANSEGYNEARPVTGDVNRPAPTDLSHIDPVKLKLAQTLKLTDPKEISQKLGIDIKSAKDISQAIKPVDVVNNPTGLTAGTQGNYSKFDPAEWYVNSDRITDASKIDYQLQQADKATNKERSLVAKMFAATGNLPKVGMVTSAFRENAGYLGQEFFVKELKGDQAVLESPRKKSLGITVPVSDIQMRDPAVVEPDTKAYYDHIFQKNFDVADLDKPGQLPFQAKIAQIAQEYGLANNQLRSLKLEMANRFTERLADANTPEEQARLAKITDEVNQHIMDEDKIAANGINNQAYRLSRNANANGMYIENTPTGYKIRNLDTQEVLGEFHTPKQGLDFINKSGQASALDIDAQSPIPTNAVPGTNAPIPSLAPPGLKTQLEDLVAESRGGWLDKLRGKAQAFSVSAPWLSTMRDFVTSIDEAHSTNLFKSYDRLQRAGMLLENTVKKAYDEAEPLMRELRAKFPDVDSMTLAARYRETLSKDEIISSLFRDRPLSQGERDVAQFIADKNLDDSKVLKYRTQRNNIIAQVKAAQFNEYGNFDNAIKLAKSDADRAVLLKTKAAGFAKVAKQFKPTFDALDAQFKLTPDETDLFHKFEAIAGNGINEVSIYGATRLAAALKNPDVNGLSRGEFAAKYNLRPDQISTIEKLDRFYEDYADKFGIEESRRINGYLNHMRQIGGDLEDPQAMMRYTAHLENPNAARFMSDMIRTGEVQDYNHDIVEAMRGYIRGGYKARILFPEIYGREVGNRMIPGAKADIEDQIKETLMPPQTQGAVFKRMSEYVESLSGRQPIPDAVYKEAATNYLNKIGVEIPTQPIQTGGGVSSLLSTVQAAYTGGKLAQGMRDATDITSKYFIHFGAARASNFVKATFDRSQISDLLQKGIIRGVDRNSFINPVESSIYGKASSAMGKVQDQLFAATMQRKVFLQAQAAAYLEAKSFSAPIFNDLVGGKATLEDAVSKLSLRRFEDPVTTEVGRLLESHGAEAAADFYGRQAARKVVGLFGHGEQPAGWNGKVGRIAGSMGMYPVSLRQFMVDVGTRGTPKEIAGAYGRWAISQGALFVTGKVAGFDMGKWVMTPASVIFTGGPLVQFASSLGSAASTVSDGENQQKFAYNNLKRLFPSLNDPRSMFLPGSYEAYNIMKGISMMNDGDWRGPVQMLGVNASTGPNITDTGDIGAPYMFNQGLKDLQSKNGF